MMAPKCEGILAVEPSGDGVCEFGDECAASDLRGQARLDAHERHKPRWLIEDGSDVQLVPS